MPNLYGLIGFPLSHSFSKGYFSEKFEREHIKDCRYETFELKTIEELPALIKAQTELKGLNVTIPYKQQVIPYLSKLDESAQKVGAVNVIKVGDQNTLIGYNSDYYGFKESLMEWIGKANDLSALVLGSGGASRAVCATLEDLGIAYQVVSRSNGQGRMSYQDVKDNPNLIDSHKLIINTTPLGMSPETDTYPDLNYSLLTNGHFLYDIVYNPEETVFLNKGALQGAYIKNGLEMLHLQAEKSWEIWNK
ncbi:MAG: shikimate dehydrogenase [Bacteroidota bacterium]